MYKMFTSSTDSTDSSLVENYKQKLHAITNANDKPIIKFNKLNELIKQIATLTINKNSNLKASGWFLMANIFEIQAEMYIKASQFEKATQLYNECMRCISEAESLYNKSGNLINLSNANLYDVSSPADARNQLIEKYSPLLLNSQKNQPSHSLPKFNK